MAQEKKSGRLRFFGRRSLTLDITVVIVLAVTLVSVISLGANLLIGTRENEQQFSRKSGEYLSFLKEGLEIPLWNFDSQAAMTQGIGYHLQYVFSPDDRRVILATGHNGGCKAWLNGALVYHVHLRHYSRYLVVQTPIALKQGWNVLLIKTERTRSGWKTSGHILAPDGKPFADLRYSARPADET